MRLEGTISARRLPRHPSPPRLGLTSYLAYLWAAPTSALGVLSLLLASAARPIAGRVGTQVVDGVLEIHGGLVTLFLKHCTPLKGGARAMTLGHVVLGVNRRELASTRTHERVHVRQCERWGPLFVPAYLLASAALKLRGRNAYHDNPFEREAFGEDEGVKG